MMRRVWLSALVLGCMGGVMAAQEKPAEKQAAMPMERGESAAPVDSVTTGSVEAGGKAIEYKAVAGTLTVGATDTQDAMLGLDGRWLKDSGVDMPTKAEEMPPTARMFYTAYFAKGADMGTRPVTFIYNGGPGSATMYLHMGAFGPKRIKMTDVQHDEGGPYHLVNNQYSLLDVSDLVFIDAPGTGFSRVMGKDAGKAFYGTDQDGQAFDRFIRRFLTKYDRWLSPKFLFGESYGTTRDAVLVRDLARSGVDVNGVVFLSQILSFDNSADGALVNPGTENRFYLSLPTFAATAWYHHKVPNQPATLEPWLHEVEQYALGEYASALVQGADLSAEKKAAVAAKLESYTGVPAKTWVKADLRMSGSEFAGLLQTDESVTTGRLDSRYSGPAMDPMATESGYDPFTQSTTASFLAAINAYARNDLKFGDNLTYKPSARDPNFNWELRHRVNGAGWPEGSVNVMNDLADTMKQNTKLHVLLMGGYFDMGTLYFGAEYEMKHLAIPASLEKNVEYKFFETGHMVYVNEDALKGLHERTAAFIKENEKGQ